MAKIKFKAKIENVYNSSDGEIAYRIIHVPTLAKRHCDMDAFRRHPKFGGLANSDLFPNVLSRIRKDVLGSAYCDHIRMDKLPPNVTVDHSAFLATVTIEA